MTRIGMKGQGGRRPSAISIFAACASIVLHATLLSPVLLGYFLISSPPRKVLRVQSSIGEESDDAMTAVFIENEAGLSSSGQSPDFPGTPVISIQEVKIAALSESATVVDSVNSSDDESRYQGETDQDPDQVGAFGRYLGQVDARIDRAWRRPRTPLSEGRFTCLARIEQDRRGNVLQVELQNCSSNWRWQMSLVHAIQSASPLPAPSDPSLFVPTITIGFSSAPFAADSNSEGFEPEAQ